MKTLLRSAFSMLVASALFVPAEARAQALFSNGTGKCSDTNWGEIKDVDDSFDVDTEGKDGFTGAGLMWYGQMHGLDVGAFYDCWAPGTAPTGSGTGYGNLPVSTVVPLGWGQLTAQSLTWSTFRLATLEVGTGWTGAQLTFRGYLNSWKDTPWTSTETVTADRLTKWTLNTPEIRFFTIDVAFDTGDDTFDSADLQRPINNVDAPYQTYFVNSVNYTVPEPTTYALLGAGLVGLVGVARRRRQAQA